MSRIHAEAAYDRFVFEIVADRRELADAIVSRFRATRRRHGLTDRLRFDISAGEPAAPPAAGRLIYESGRGSVYWEEGEGRLSVFAPSGYAVAPLEEARVEIVVDEGATDEIWVASRPLFTIPLLELLRARGLYSLHAGGVARGDRCLLVSGTSGVGKSTLTAALVAEGFSFLGDDMLFLEADPDGGFVVLPFPDVLDLSERSLALLGLGSVPRSRLGGIEKWQVDPVEAGFELADGPTRPQVVVFPALSAGEPRITEVSVEEALLELAPNVLLTDPGRIQAHLDALSYLAVSARAFRLAAGDDPARAAAAVAELVA